MSINGITYYKEPEHEYEGSEDVVKNTSLTGREVDNNFNVLEGRDVKNVSVSETGNEFVITFYNGEEVRCENPYKETVNTIEFDYHKSSGVLDIIINEDTENTISVEGFLTKKDVEEIVPAYSVFTDQTLHGNGSSTNPLSISSHFRTGMIKPVINKVTELPTEGLNVGDRYITTESVNVCGALYNFKGVRNIIDNIEGTKWRVACKHDWDDMLNALEPEKEDRNHQLRECNVYLGENANAYLSLPIYNFNPVFCGYANEEDEMHVAYYGKRTAWWTASNDDDKNAYYKRIDEFTDGVYQDIVDSANFYSVRLVRDIENNEELNAETIMGTTYPTTMMPSLEKGLRMWTAVNFSSDLVPVEIEEGLFDNMDNCIYRPEEFPESEDVNYVNEWDGTKWVKMTIDQHDMFYVTELEDYYHLEGNDIVSIETGEPIHISEQVNELEERVTIVEESMDTISDNVNNLNGQVETLTSSVSTMQKQVEESNNNVTIAVEQAAKSRHFVEILSTIIDRLKERIEVLESFHRVDITNMWLRDALDYRYENYEYHGVFEIYNKQVDYTIRTEQVARDQRVVMYDLARFLGALYRTNKVDPIIYNDVLYSWNSEGTLKGSNYMYDVETSLVSVIVEDYSNNCQSDGSWDFELVINDVPVIVTIGLI